MGDEGGRGSSPAAAGGADGARRGKLEEVAKASSERADERFRELHTAMERHFSEQAHSLEEIARKQNRMLAQCLHHLSTPGQGAHGSRELGAQSFSREPEKLGTHSTDAEVSGGVVHQSVEAARGDESQVLHDMLHVKPFARVGGSYPEERSRVVQQIMRGQTDDLGDIKGNPCPNSEQEQSYSDFRSLMSLARGNRVDSASWLAQLLQNPLFDQTVGLLILANAVFIGYVADWQANNVGSNEPGWFLILDIVFAGMFFLELSAKLVVYRTSFFRNAEWRWNLFDTFVVFSGILELCVDLIDSVSVAADVTYLRIMRIMKLVRVVRIVRVVLVFRELRIMLFSVVATLRSLIWTLISLFGLTFMAGVYVTSAVAAYQNNSFDPNLAKYFGSLSKTLLALFQATAGGLDWRQLTDELEKVSGFVVAIFVLYVCMVIYAVMNILTGVCVNQATRAADDDVEFVIQDELTRRNGATNTLRRFFHDADEEGTGQLTWLRLREHLRNTEVRHYFKALGIEIWDLRTFFDLLGTPGQELASIDIDQFVRGCLRLKGHPKNSDLLALRLEIDNLAKASCAIQASLAHEIRSNLFQDAKNRPAPPERTDTQEDDGIDEETPVQLVGSMTKL